MRREGIVRYCLSKPGAVETWPFGDGVAVFKAAGKLFALCPVDADPPEISLKCDPTLAMALRSTYKAVRPGYHLNKRHWNTVTLDGSIDDDEVQEWIDHSYELVVAKLPRSERETLRPEGGAGSGQATISGRAAIRGADPARGVLGMRGARQ